MASQKPRSTGQQVPLSACLPRPRAQERSREDWREELVFSPQDRNMKEGSYSEWQCARTSRRDMQKVLKQA